MVDNYGTVEGYKTYCFERNSLYTHEPDDKILAALLVASEWIDSTYRSLFSGFKIGQREQVREWPRNGAIDIYGYGVSPESIPAEVQNATYEAAIRQMATPGSLSADYTPSKYISAQIDGAVNVTYRKFDSAMDTQTRLTIVDQILAPLLTGQSAGSSVTGYALRG